MTTTLKKKQTIQAKMRQLNKLQTIIFLSGAVLMVIGAGTYVFSAWAASAVVFAIGAIAFASMQLMQTYDGNNISLRRLRRIMSIGDVMFILSAILMLENSFRFLLPLFTNYFSNGYYYYVTYINNNWVVLLLIAAILEIYTTHRISNELKKDNG